MRNGRAWNVPPRKVAPPVIAPRDNELPRPVTDPSSERPSDRPIEIAAPSALARPTSSAAREPARKAAAKIGASVEIVPSMRPISPGWTRWRTTRRCSAATAPAAPSAVGRCSAWSVMRPIIQDAKDKDALTCTSDVARPSTAETERVAEQRLVAALRERGQRVTSQRLIIHRLLRDLDRHVTAEEVLRRASEQLPGMSLPTVYATLDLLTELGVARRVSVGGPVLYDPRVADHAHLRCRVCGRVEDLEIPFDT